jgi:hypothetical protein
MGWLKAWTRICRMLKKERMIMMLRTFGRMKVGFIVLNAKIVLGLYIFLFIYANLS